MQDIKIPNITDKAEISRLLHNLGTYVKSRQFEQEIEDTAIELDGIK